MLKTEIIHSSTLQRFENECLKPFRYLFNGRSFVILNNQILRDAPCASSRTMLGVAKAIALLIPGLILGTMAHLFNLLNKEYRQRQSLVEEFMLKKVTLPHAPEGVTLGEYSKSYGQKYSPLLERIQSDRSIWKDPKFIQEYSEVMEDGYKYMDLYFREVTNKCHQDKNKIVKEMITQPQQRTQPGQNYCHTFFVMSQYYHIARGCTVRVDRELAAAMGYGPDEPMPLSDMKSKLSYSDQEPYFNPTKPQYRWRQLYNAFCDLVDKNGMRGLLESPKGDRRFSNWSRPDLKEVKSFYPPDTMPT